MSSDSASVRPYLASIRAFPLLSSEQERTLAEAYLRDGDVEAAHQLVTANLRFVVLIARRYTTSGARLADLIQEGNIGLMEAVKRFDPSRGVRLVTYASWWIRAYMRQHLLRSASLVRAAAGSDAFEGDLPLDGASEDLALAVAGESSPEDGLADAQEREVARRRITEALTHLDERERFLVGARLLTDEPLSLREVGRRFGCSQERVHQLQARAQRKLGVHLRAAELEVA
ncbi:MAG TPA: sigma-70 family RNA polymerase sigma factor [Anaeromyxobacteraceae bacterium]|nr:sigma-70 family RNA polymerase sigma factor [Anaeromyxobacteraceae bacterium]